MTPAASQDMPSTGTAPLLCFPRLVSSATVGCPSFYACCPLSALSFSTETINDGQFHTVELVTFDQMVNLSIDGGLPTTMDSFGAVRTLNGEAPLYVGGRGPLQNTPPSSAGTLTTTLLSITTLPLRFVTTATAPLPSTIPTFCPVLSSLPHPRSCHPPSSLGTVFGSKCPNGPITATEGHEMGQNFMGKGRTLLAILRTTRHSLHICSAVDGCACCEWIC